MANDLLLKIVDRRMVETYKFFPLAIMPNGDLIIAITEDKKELVSNIQFLLGCNVVPTITNQRNIDYWIYQNYE